MVLIDSLITESKFYREMAEILITINFNERVIKELNEDSVSKTHKRHSNEIEIKRLGDQIVSLKMKYNEMVDFLQRSPMKLKSLQI